MPKYYLYAEAFNLNTTVYDTHDISTIRGGSYILLDAIKQLPGAVPGQLEPIATAASKGLFSYEDPGDLAAQQGGMVLQVRRALDKLTGGHATFGVAVESDSGDFPGALARLEAAVRRQQWRMPTVVVPAPEATDQECYLDGWRPGVHAYNVDPTVAGVKISRATQYRRQRGRQIKHTLFRELFAGEDADDDLCVQDLGELASSPSKGILSGKIALFHADGNRFGRIRAAMCTTRAARQAFDERIQERREMFLADLRAAALADPDFQVPRQGGKSALRLEILLWGGDECTIVVPAWRGLELFERFFRAMAGLEFEGVPMSHGAALVFCHHNAPILQIRQLADQLLNTAKEDIEKQLQAALHSDPALAGLAQPDRDLIQQWLSHPQYGNAARYLVLESFDMLRGSLDQFLHRYYAGVASSRLLLYGHDLPLLRSRLHTICAAAPKGRVVEIARALSENDLVRVTDLAQRLGASLDPDQREAVMAAIAALTDDNPAGWYLLADLWDYAEEWKA